MKIRHPVTLRHSVLGEILPRSQEEVCVHICETEESVKGSICVCVCERESGVLY